MDFDTFLTSPRWDILQIVAKVPSSPIEIAEKLNTTVSYVSQQLKLLDAAGLIVKQKTGAFEKGKPRTLFTVPEEFVYITLLTKGLSSKKLLNLTKYHKVIMSLWMLDDLSLHHPLTKVFLILEDNLSEIEVIAIDTSLIVPRLLLISDSKKIKANMEALVKKLEKPIEYFFVSKAEIEKIDLNKLIFLHGGEDFHIQLKGGKNNL